MKLRAIIVDDEQHCIDTLSHDLEMYCADQVSLVGHAMNAIEATAQINKHRPDLIFMDIELPGMSGLAFLESIGELSARVIFTTAYSQYAVEGYKFKAAAYLLKPVDKSELKEVIGRLYDEHQTTHSVLDNKLAVADTKGIEFIEIDTIRVCEANNNYTLIHLTSGEQHVVSKTLKVIEEQLSASSFARINQSFLVNLKFVKKYLKTDGGAIEMDDGSTYRLTKAYRDSFLDLLK